MKKQIARVLGTRCRLVRVHLKLTQADVAEMLGVSTEFYARIERGHAVPSLLTFMKLTAVLSTQPNHLLHDDQLQGSLSENFVPVKVDENRECPEFCRLVRHLRKSPSRHSRILYKIAKELDEE